MFVTAVHCCRAEEKIKGEQQNSQQQSRICSFVNVVQY